jgi:O-antigen/teichoic acid export membrane protein
MWIALTKSEIRVQYAGFIIFGARMLSVITGLAFTLMLTRSTTDTEYGIWGNINDVLTYFIFLSPALAFWAMRFAARGKEGAVKTGLIANTIIAIVATVIYLPIIPIIISSLHVSQNYLILYLIASMQIIENYLITMFEGCLRGIRPQTLGYGLLIEESLKVLMAYILIIRLGQPLLGALISIIAGFAIQSAYYFKILSPELKQPIKWSYVKEWLKGSTANIYYYLGDRIAASVFIMLVAYNPTAGPAARGYYLVAMTIAGIITYSSFLSFALYPKLLAENNVQDIKTSLKTVLMFAIPMAAGAIALSDSYLAVQNQIYEQASALLIILAINALVQVISQFYSSVLWGYEKIDEKSEIPLKKLVKTRLFKAFTLPYVHSAIALPTTFYLLTNFAKNQPISAAIYVGIIDTVARSVTFLALYVIMWKTVKIDVPWMNIAKYSAASTVMALFLALAIIPHPTRLSIILGMTVAGAIIYFALLSVIDKEARELIRSIWQEIKLRF